jgi:hypothetical protein
MHFDHREFVLDLDSSWISLGGNDPEQHLFESKALASTLTISVMSAAIPEAKMKQAAQKLLDLRRMAETETRPTGVVAFGDQRVTPKLDQHLVEVAYTGYDNRGRIFRFMGFVTNEKIVSFYCETVSKDNEQAKRTFDDCFCGFRFYVP